MAARRRGSRADQTEYPVGWHTIDEVVAACGLPGPAVMQLVPRTWTDYGWMFTTEQLNASVVIAEELRRGLAAERLADGGTGAP